VLRGRIRRNGDNVILLVGNGKLARSIEEYFTNIYPITKINDFSEYSCNEKSILIHCGSGRQLASSIEFCMRTNSILLELSTSQINIDKSITFPLILCPNTALLVLKTLKMLKENGKYFSEYRVEIIESHQSSKTATAGTAIELAHSFNKKGKCIQSIRDKNKQIEFGVPGEYLDLHAYHEVKIFDDGCEIQISTKVNGHAAYVAGIKEIINILQNKKLDNKVYNITDII
jgi:4-hydroxy-tetrahydrodipicolinate reductase